MPRPKVPENSEVICSEGTFSVVRLRSGEFAGQVAALWENHGEIYPDLAALHDAGVLNSHEKTLLRYGAKDAKDTAKMV